MLSYSVRCQKNLSITLTENSKMQQRAVSHSSVSLQAAFAVAEGYKPSSPPKKLSGREFDR